MAEPEKRKQKGGKKSRKKGWKNTNVSEIEEHLVEARRDERTGGLTDEKSDAALFFVDKKNKVSNGNKEKEETKNKFSDDDDEVYVSRKQKLHQKLAKEKQKEEQNAKLKRTAEARNIWGQEVMTVRDAYLDSTVKKPKVKPSTVCVGGNQIEAIALPDAGASYHPDYESHQGLLSKVHDVELKKLTEQEKINKKVKMVSVKELKKQSKVWLKEMSEGLFENNNQEKASDCHEDNEEKGVTPSAISAEDRKTLKTRRKEQLSKEQEKQKGDEKKEKAKLNDIYRIKTLKREINASDERSVKRKRKRSEQCIHQMKTRTKKLSKHKYQEPPISVLLSEELSGSLRGLKPDGSLLEDRFKSLQKRNIIETRKPVLPHRKYKRKTYQKKSYSTEAITEFKPKR